MKKITVDRACFAVQEIDGRARAGTRRAARLCANGTRTDRSAEFVSANSVCWRCGGTQRAHGDRRDAAAASFATGSSSLSSSTARTRPAASALPKRSIRNFSMPAPTPITLGNHSWDQREALVFIERAPTPDSSGEFSGRTRPDAVRRSSTPKTASARWSSTASAAFS